MTTGIGQSRPTFADAHASLQPQRHSYDGSGKELRFGDAKELYLLREFSRRYFNDGGAAAADRATKWTCAGHHIFRAIENEYGRDIAASLFDRVGAGEAVDRAWTLGQPDQMKTVLDNAPAAVGIRNTSAHLDGTDRRMNFSTDVLEETQILASGHFRQVVATADHPDWTSTDKTPNAGLSHSMVGDFGRADIFVNGIQVSSASEQLGTPEEQAAAARQRLLDSGIRTEDLRVLSACLHRGMIVDMQKAALDHPAAPVPFSFGPAPEKDQIEIGYGIDSASDDGVYKFFATIKAPFSTVREVAVAGSDQGVRQEIVFDHAKAGTGGYAFELHGTISCNDTAVSFDSANLSYHGELKQGR